MKLPHLSNNRILDKKYNEPGYLSKDGSWAAVPYKNQFMIIHNGEQVRLCRTFDSAVKFIQTNVKAESKPQSKSSIKF